MRVVQARSWSAQDVADSYALWWREAGLHSLTSPAAHGWLAADESAPASAVAELPRQRVAEAATVVPIRAPDAPYMPRDLAAFRAWLAQEEAQPEAGWSGPMFLPPEATSARLLILCDMPDDVATGPALPLSGAATRFVEAMLSALGLALDDVAFAPLAMRRPPGGLLDDATVRTLAARMRHYLGLASPRAALILGDRTSRALLAAQAAPAPGNLPQINHDSGTLPVAALAGPELLMRRPLAKAASWQTLRLLNGVIAT